MGTEGARRPRTHSLGSSIMKLRTAMVWAVGVTILILSMSTTARAAVLFESPSAIGAGGVATTAWGEIDSPTPRDWVGLYAAGANDTDFQAWVYVSCSHTPTTAAATGVCAFGLPNRLPSGLYEMRLFANDGFERLATSETFTVSPGRSDTVTFSSINDAVPSRFFDASTTGPDPNNPNRLVIGLNTGFDQGLSKFRSFAASSAAFFHSAAMDTISFLVEAPPGFYVARITYSQKGTGSLSRSGRAAGGTQWTVGAAAIDLGTFEINPTLSASIDLTGQLGTVYPVSITTSLFAFALPQVGSAAVTLTSAEVLVELLPLP